MSNKRHSVGGWLLGLVLACAVFFGIWLNRNENKPHPVMYLNLGSAYFEQRNIEKAIEAWKICADFNEIYATHYDENNQQDFGGQHIKSCKKNIKSFSEYLNDPLLRRGK